jgi:hypothetical protein
VIADDANEAGEGVCRHLKTKMLYVAGRESASFERPSSTAPWWCLHTMSPVGPDDAQALPRRCRAGRSCFEPLDE